MWCDQTSQYSRHQAGNLPPSGRPMPAIPRLRSIIISSPLANLSSSGQCPDRDLYLASFCRYSPLSPHSAGPCDSMTEESLQPASYPHDRAVPDFPIGPQFPTSPEGHEFFSPEILSFSFP